MKVAITGATGTIGGRLVVALLGRGDEVVPLSRSTGGVHGVASVRWEPATEAMPLAATDGVDAVINLAGAPVDGGRWTASRKAAILDSRVVTTHRVAEALAGGAGPRVLVNASAVGFYGDRPSGDVDESSPSGTGFLPDVCTAWERAARGAKAGGVRVAMARIGIVLAHEGGALPKLARVTRMWAAGPVGGGRQWMPWVAVDDVVGMIMAALDDERWRGPFNATAPDPVRQRDFANALGTVLDRPTILPTPGFAVKAAMGEMAAIVLEGQRALPLVAQANGYIWRFPTLDTALRHEVGRAGAVGGNG